MTYEEMAEAMFLSKLQDAIDSRFERKDRLSFIKGSLIEWCKQAIPQYFYLPPNRQHLWVSDQLSSAAIERNVRLVVEGPRDSAKSTVITTGYPLYGVCEEFETYILLVSETGDQALKYLSSIKAELETNSFIEENYPQAFGPGPLWNKESIITKNGVMIEALGAGKSIRGRKAKEHRPSCIIVDDPEGENAAYSSLARSRIRDWFTKGVGGAGAPDTNFFVIGTRIHRECLTAHLTGMAGWKHRTFVSMIKWPDRMDLWRKWDSIYADQLDDMREQKAREFYDSNKAEMDKGAEVLWPEREDLYALMMLRAANGPVSFESEKQNNPIDPSRCEWTPDYFEGEDLWFDEWPEECEIAIMSLDPSKGRQDRSGDYQAIVMLAFGNDGYLYVDADISRRPINQMVKQFVEIAGNFNPDMAVVEAEHFQEILVRECEDEAVKSKINFPIRPIMTEGVNKDVRIRRLSQYVTRRKIRYKKRSRGVVLLIRQMMDFPNGDFDDGPDALEMAVRKAEEVLNLRKSNKVDDPY